MNKTVLIILLLVVFLGFLFLNNKSPLNRSKKVDISELKTNNQPIGLANPADQFCIDNGGKLSTVNSNAGVSSNCTFPNGKTCDSWALFRGECIVDGINNFATYGSGVDILTANYRIKANTVILNSEKLSLNNVELKIAESGSGARYLSPDGKIEFWEHQGEATVKVDGKEVFVGKNTNIKTVSCFDGGKEYKDGDSLRKLSDKPGILADASYVCKSGEWVIIGDGSESGIKPPTK